VRFKKCHLVSVVLLQKTSECVASNFVSFDCDDVTSTNEAGGNRRGKLGRLHARRCASVLKLKKINNFV
jgi:hypothetical protein